MTNEGPTSLCPGIDEGLSQAELVLILPLEPGDGRCAILINGVELVVTQPNELPEVAHWCMDSRFLSLRSIPQTSQELSCCPEHVRPQTM
jgi:hypothetical protein